MTSGKPNKGQHVVPECYLKQFGAANGALWVQNKDGGKTFVSGPPALCQENEIFTMMVNGKRDYSFESINNDIETEVGVILQELQGRPDLGDPAVQSRFFTIFLAFTANLIARSTVLKVTTETVMELAADIFEKMPEEKHVEAERRWRIFCANPNAFPEIKKKFGDGAKHLKMMHEYHKAIPAPPEAQEAAANMRKLNDIHYKVFLKPRTGATVRTILDIAAKADILTTDIHRLITCDDPVVFLTHGKRETSIVPTADCFWTEPERGVYLPLNPHTAILWNSEGTYSYRAISAEDVQRYNNAMKDQAIRHLIACSPSDFP